MAVFQIEKRAIELIKSDPASRRYLAEKAAIYHAIAYHPEFFKYPFAPFHYELFADFEELCDGTLKEAAWIMFRESAKTSIAKLCLEWAIVHGKRRYVNWDSFDKENAEQALFDVSLWLQTNGLLIADYGQLYFRSKDDYSSKMKRVGNFITEAHTRIRNGVRREIPSVKVEAFSTQQSTRGRIFGDVRPDLYIMDDFETAKTRDSYPMTSKVIKHIQEAQSGLGVNGSILYLGNLITEEGSVQHIIDTLAPRDNAMVREIPVMDPDTGELAWPGKYVKTKAEALKVNAGILDPLRRLVSIEQKREDLTERVFQPEMMNNPTQAGDLVFDRVRIEELMRFAREPRKVDAGAYIFETYKPGHRYGLGADTAEGNGLDSNTTAIIDYTRDKPILVLTFASNEIDSHQLGNEIIRQGEWYGTCYVGPEVNNTGFATLARLREGYPLEMIHMREETDQVKKTKEKRLGWRTTIANKSEIILQLKAAVEDGELVIPDIRVLEEMKYYKLRDLVSRKSEEGATRHFDLLMAVAIAWALRDHAPVPKDLLKKQVKPQSPYEPMSAFEIGGGQAGHTPLNQRTDRL